MSFNVIDKSMVVKNTIELQPVHTYVSASNECNDFLSLGIEGAGITGELPARINNINGFKPGTNNFDSKRIFYVDDHYETDVIDQISVLNKSKSNNAEIVYLNDLISNGLYEDKIGDYRFGVEKVENRYLIDDSGEYKKKSIKNLYKFYRENIQYRVLNPQWGFSNYNCMKFFNVENNKTHKNCIIYPNLYHDNKHVYETFKDNDNLTISFYINQNTKNKVGYSFNPGCILYLPGIVGIYIVKGSSVDNSGLTDAYRLYIEFGHKTYDDFSADNRAWLNSKILEGGSNITNSSIDLNSTNGQYLSEDNLIKFNNWHNITLKIKKIRSDIQGTSLTKNLILKFSLFLDGVRIDEKDFSNVIDNVTSTFVNAYNFKSVNSFICIGNRPSNFDNQGTNEDDMFVKLFSTANEVNEDSVGPYVNKNISFGSNFDENINALIHTSTNETLEFKNILPATDNPNYVNDNSLALSAELHDIRIYKENINNIKSKICDKNINNFNDDKLIFSVPVYYYDVDIKKKSIINLMGISASIDNNGSVGNIFTSHTLIEGPINPYFSNKCLGHEVIVEKFLYEFVNKTSPNVIWGGDTLSDSTLYNSYNLISTNKNLNNSNDANVELIKRGISPNKIVNKSREAIKDLDNFTTIYQDHYANANIQYKNNFIMPCDNGLQSQSFSNIVGYYENEYSGIGHKDSFDNNDFQLISLDKIYTSKVVYFPETSVITETCNGSLFNALDYLDLDEREDYTIEGNKKFKESYDLLRNVSLSNYFNSSFELSSINNSDVRLRSITNQDNFFELGRNQFLKNASNHAMRVINDDHRVSIASHLLPIDEKNIDRDANTPDRIGYFRYEMPLLNTSGLYCEHFTKALCISTEIFGKELRRGSVELFDSDLGGTLGNIKINLKDNEKGTMYRADALTKHAKWNYVGHCLYKEGIITILHPSLHNFAENSFKLDFRSSFSINTLEINLPAYQGMINKSNNTSYIENLKLNNSSFNFDDDFVYITDINLHDENLNIVAKAKLANPYAKKSLDSVLFRIKMDF